MLKLKQKFFQKLFKNAINLSITCRMSVVFWGDSNSVKISCESVTFVTF